MNSIIIGRVGAYCGSVNYYKEKSWVSDNAISAQLVDDSMNIEYFYYLMKSLNLNNKRIGTSQPLLTQDILKNIEFEILSNLNQNKIASILSNLDRKIEVNNKIIDNLEQQAQAIFKSWFIDFEPFQDGEFVDSELGPIPKWWEVIKLGSVFNFVKGKKPPKIENTSNLIPYIVKGVVDGSAQPEMAELKNVVMINELDIFMLMDGANSGNVYYGFKGALGSTFSLLDVDPKFQEVLYWYLFRKQQSIKNQNTGSAIPHANKDYINNIQIAVPQTNNEINISLLLRNLRKYIIKLKRQNQKLAETRDLLLPKLMSGELDVSDLDI